MSKKKKKENISSTKIALIGLASLAAIIVIAMIISFIANFEFTKNLPYYRCTNYSLVEKAYDGTKGEYVDVVDDILVDYSYYKITFKKNGTFVHEFQSKNSKNITIEKGKYTKDKDSYTLIYDDFIDEPEEVIYVIDGNTITREQTVARMDEDNNVYFRGTILQTFEYVDVK